MRTPSPQPRRRTARSLAVLVALFACACAGAGSASAAELPGAHISAAKYSAPATYPGLKHLHYKFGPVTIQPGQNTIDVAPNSLKPDVAGYITRFSPNLVYVKGGKVPRVDVVHLHHGVWLMNGQPTFAAGEEKTIFNAPLGYGYHYDPSDGWLMNYMIHNLYPTKTQVYITYDIDFLPDTTAAAQQITPVKPLWMDVAGVAPYPVFDALKGTGKRGKYTFPGDARGKAKQDIGPAHQWAVSKDLTLVGTAGHLHPGGLRTDLKATRGSDTKELFRSEAKYFEPAGAVSWDVSMTATDADWKVALKAGDTVNVSATYDTSKASWYEAMGIMVVWYADGVQPGSKDPFSEEVDWHGELTHGHLAENDHHGGARNPALPNPGSLLSGPPLRNVDIEGYAYRQGDLALPGRQGRPPVVRRGRSLTFTNKDSLPGMSLKSSAYHTITACKAPCNRTTGIAYPVANAKYQFDSAELGYGPAGFTAASNRHKWKTPKTLPRGTYAYFCRIHPFMRGSFRVK